MGRRSFLAPEIVQVSSMDCGVAAMACFLQGVGIGASYERLREACHTDVDGTSIDALEDLGNQLGIDCIQHLLPPESILEEASKRQPAIAVTTTGGDTAHFVVLWRRVGKHWNVMDPAHGRFWIHEKSLLRRLKSHGQLFGADEFMAWALGSSFAPGLVDRITRITGRAAAEQALAATKSDGSWRSIAALDAALRFTEAIIGTKRPSWSAALFFKAAETARRAPDEIQERFWSIREGPGDTVRLTGNILLANAAAASPIHDGSPPAAGVPESLIRAVSEPEPSLWQMLRGLGDRSFPGLVWLIAALSTASALVSLIEVLVVRASLTSSVFFSQVTQKVGLLVWVASMFGVLLAIECASALLLRRLGRQIETNLRVGLFESLPRLDDTFIRSRPTSDLAQRAQGIPGTREIPNVLAGALRNGVDLCFTVVAMATLDPWIAVFALASAAFSAVFATVVRSKGEELESKVQSNEAGILHVMQDALLGSVPVRVHGAENALVREQRERLRPWVTTQRERLVFHSLTSLFEQSVTYFFIVAMLWRGLAAFSHGAGFLILIFWALRLPSATGGLIGAVQVLPLYRVALRRAIEPLRSAAGVVREESAPPVQRAGGVALRFKDVSVMASGQSILDDVRLDIRPGEHIAIVGRSGAGKSTLVSLLLGIHSPASGRIYMDGEELTKPRLEQLRKQTAWLDPSVFLWNETFLYNLAYAHPDAGFHATQNALEVTDLVGVVERLPSGLMSGIGNSGMLLSGGEGQRLRLARGLLGPSSRLALLDEPFRGLDRSARARMMRTVRETFSRQTLLVVTHDVQHVEGFDRVLVIEDGRVKEDGVPAELLKRPSRFRDLFEADWHNQDRVWGGARWRYIEVQAGVALVDNDADGTWGRQ